MAFCSCTPTSTIGFCGAYPFGATFRSDRCGLGYDYRSIYRGLLNAGGRRPSLPYTTTRFHLSAQYYRLRHCLLPVVSLASARAPSGDKAAVLFDDYSPWEKLVTMPLKILQKL